jgi:response regulator NasT
MKKAIIVSGNANTLGALKTILLDEGFNVVLTSQSGDDACGIINEENPEFIIINTPLADENGLDFAVKCSEATSACIVVIVKSDKADMVANKLVQYGIMVISKPINKHLFHHYLLFEECFRKRMTRFVNDNKKLRTQVETMKLVNRAKMLLMQNLRMTEGQAHHYLEKQAMDLRKSKYDIALSVLKTYEN